MSKPLDHPIYIPQGDYARKLRPLLPSEAFLPDLSRAWILGVNLIILMIGWSIATGLHQWNWQLLWLYLPLALLMGNAIIVLLFSTHDLLHSSAIRNLALRRLISLLGLTMLWMPPTLWRAVHNREHHNKTNALGDPDRNYLYEQPHTWGKWIQNLFVPSLEVHPFFLLIGMAHAWGIYAFRNLTSILFFNNGLPAYPPAAFIVSSKERRSIGFEFFLILIAHASILFTLGFHVSNLLLGYFLPIWIGHAGIMFYVYTNHMLSPMTPLNDPLVNSVSVRVPKIFDLLHLNFSYHTEHHIFPGMNSDYYPLVQQILLEQFPDRYQVLDIMTAWRLLVQTPRHYQDAHTLTDSSGEICIPCPLLREAISTSSIQPEASLPTDPTP